MAEVAAIAKGVGLGIKTIGAVRQGEAEGAAADYNAAVDEQNAQLALKQAGEQERRTRLISRKQIGKQRANIGSSGITLEGSALDALEESAANAELDALNVRYQGQLQAYAYRTRSQLYRYQGKNARTTGYLNAAGILVGGIGDVAGTAAAAGGA